MLLNVFAVVDTHPIGIVSVPISIVPLTARVTVAIRVIGVGIKFPLTMRRVNRIVYPCFLEEFLLGAWLATMSIRSGQLRTVHTNTMWDLGHWLAPTVYVTRPL